MATRNELNEFAVAVGCNLSQMLKRVGVELLGIQVREGKRDTEESKDEYLLIGEAKRKATGEAVAFRHRFEAVIKNTTIKSVESYSSKIFGEIFDYFYNNKEIILPRGMKNGPRHS